MTQLNKNVFVQIFKRKVGKSAKELKKNKKKTFTQKNSN